MICRLCINDCEDNKDLYDADGQLSEVCKVSAKYFGDQLQDVGVAACGDYKYSRVICVACWEKISDFNEFHESILATREQYERQMKQTFSEFVKEEVEIEADALSIEDEFDTVPLENDPMDFTQETEVDLKILPQMGDILEIDNGSVTDDEDEKPLLSRFAGKDRPCKAKVKKSKERSSKSAEVKIKDEFRTKKRASTQVFDAVEADENEAKPRKRGASKKAELEACDSAKISKTKACDAYIAEHWKKELNCDLCEHTSPNLTKLRAHYREAHNNCKGYASCCQSKFFHRFTLIDHIKLHMNPDHFKCVHCGRRCATRRGFDIHMKSVHGPESVERPFGCDVCGKRFARKTILQSHLDIHATGNKDHVCSHCGKGFVLEHKLKVHIRTVHAASDQHVCDQCGKGFRARHALKQHLLEHQGITRKKFACDQCNAELHSRYSMLRHKRVSHHDHSTIYVCSECGKVALTEDALKSHKQYAHQKERKYKCNICDKAFKVAIVLREHMSTHTGEDLYKCPHCTKTFKVSANMHHHRKRVHPKEWLATRQKRTLAAHADISAISNEVVL